MQSFFMLIMNYPVFADSNAKQCVIDQNAGPEFHVR